MTTTTALTVADLDRAIEDDRWLGWGYLGGRQSLSQHETKRADRRLLRHANAHGWDYERLFHFLNSKPGRWYADACSDEQRGYPMNEQHATALFSDDLGLGLIP